MITHALANTGRLRHARAAILALVFSVLTGTAQAQWFSTTYALKGGWNAIYLHGDATHAAPDVLFPNSGQTAGVIEVWRWNPRPNQAQFTHSPLIPSAGTPEWNVWKRGLPAESNLSLISGQTAYLVRCSGTAATAWNVPLTQRAMPPAATWVRSGANLLGFPAKFTSPNYPAFSTYFQTFPAATAANAKIFKYVGGDLSFSNPLQIFSPTLEQVDRNKAYWFEAEVVSNFYAPLDISLSQATGLDFGRTGSVITARVRNTTAANMTLALAPVASLAAPAGQDALTGTTVPLMRRTFNAATATWTETAITAAYTEVIGANSTVELSFGINRAAMSGASNALYASLLRLTDSANLFDISLPVSARVASMAGLWVGDATLTTVSSEVQSTATAKAVLKDGVITGIEVTGGGFGYDTVPDPVIAAPTGTASATVTLSPGVPATATAVLTGGVVTAFTITNGGSGYTVAPPISIAAPASGTTATATAVLTGGTLTGVTITNGGTGYTAAPAVTVAGPRIVTGITLTSPGAGYTTAPTVSIGSAAPALGVRATATAAVSNGVITGLTLTNPGSGYASTPAVTIGQPTLGTATAVATRSGGTPAAATAVLTGGVVTGINITNGGSLYTDPPAIAIAAPPSGTTATATAVVTNGVLTGITIDDGGSGYTAVPAVTIGGRTITSITLTNAGSGYTIPPTVTLSAPAGGLGTRATAVATMRDGIITGLVVTDSGSEYGFTPTVTISSPPPGSAPAFASPVLSGGVLVGILVTNPGAGYFTPPAVTVAPPASGTTATAVAVVENGRITGITVLNPGSGYTASPAPFIFIDPPSVPAPATATAVVRNGKVTGFTIDDGGTGYSAAPAITIPEPVPMGTATARTPPLRMILHVNDSGTARLLSQVFVGKLANGSDGLCTKESGLSTADLAGASRIIATHLPLDRVLASGSGSVANGQTLVRTCTIPFDDATNPFVHRYHPDHNNKDARGNPLDAGVESYGITRTLSFQFTATPPAGVSAVGWGSSSIGGNYTEVIKGLHKRDLTVTGTFVLRRASEIGTLTIN